MTKQITTKISEVIKADDRFQLFVTFDGETFPLSEAICEDGETVDLTFHGWQGKDMDGFDTFEITGKGENFTVAGTMRNEQVYNDFINVLKVTALG